MSWLSSAWTNVRSTVTNVVSAVPVVGGVASNILGGIHTGDEHVDPVTGQWVSNSTGAPTVTPPSTALQGAIQSANEFNAAELARIRQAAADLVAKAGIGGAAAIGPQGNVYQQGIAIFSNPLTMLLVVGAGVALLYLVFHKKR